MLHLDPDALAALHHIEPHSPLAASLSSSTIQSFAKTQLPQTSHRVEIVKAWDVDLEGRSVLEIGCGQGDASVVLSSAVGNGRVAAWDPASPDYGEYPVPVVDRSNFRFSIDRFTSSSELEIKAAAGESFFQLRMPFVRRSRCRIRCCGASSLYLLFPDRGCAL